MSISSVAFHSLHRRGGLAVAALLLAAMAYLDWPDSPAPVVVAVARQQEPQTVFGPGRMRDPDRGFSFTDAIPDARLEVAPDHSLVVNSGLLEVIHSFLLVRSGGDQGAALRQYLSRQLPSPANAQAVRIAQDYQGYMQEHDKLLSAQNLDLHGEAVQAAEIARVATWQEQRSRLRQRMLGDMIVRAWYENSDLQLSQALDELRRSGADGSAPSEAEPASATGASLRPLPHWHNPVDAERHRLYLISLLKDALVSFKSMER